MVLVKERKKIEKLDYTAIHSNLYSNYKIYNFSNEIGISLWRCNEMHSLIKIVIKIIEILKN